jgi:hypothetical protein
MTRMVIPQNRLPLHLFWFLLSNVGHIIPYEIFPEISPAYEKKIQMQEAVCRVRPYLAMNGFEVMAENGVGYKCYKIEGKAK